MKKVLAVVLSVVISFIASWLLWLIFYYAIPFVFPLQEWGIIIALLFDSVGAMFVIGVSGLLLSPIYFVKKLFNKSKYFAIPFYLFHGFSAIRLPWGLNVEYNVTEYILGVILSVGVLIAFICSIYGILADNED